MVHFLDFRDGRLYVSMQRGHVAMHLLYVTQIVRLSFLQLHIQLLLGLAHQVSHLLRHDLQCIVELFLIALFFLEAIDADFNVTNSCVV